MTINFSGLHGAGREAFAEASKEGRCEHENSYRNGTRKED